MDTLGKEIARLTSDNKLLQSKLDENKDILLNLHEDKDTDKDKDKDTDKNTDTTPTSQAALKHSDPKASTTTRAHQVFTNDISTDANNNNCKHDHKLHEDMEDEKRVC